MRLGKDKQASLLAVFLLFSASAGGQAGKSYKYHFNGNLQTTDVISERQSAFLNYSISELNVENLTNENGTFYRISIPEHYHTTVPGKPELPALSRLISIPAGSDYRIKISDIVSSRINPAGKKIEGILFPAQEGESKEVQQNKAAFKIDRSVYALKGIIGSDTVRIEPISTVRGKNLANLIILPVRYNPKSNVLEVITSMKIEIIFTYNGNSAEKSMFPGPPLYKGSLSNDLLNYSKEALIPGFSNQPVKMIIVTDIAFEKQLKPFIEWKTQKGFRVKVLYRGTSTYSQIKDTLANIYKASTESDPPPEYLLIIGDVTRVPYYGSGNITDMYYGEFDGNGDYIPEMYIGRLPVADTTELKNVISKIIQYEKFEFTATNRFYSNALITAGNDAGYANYMNGQVKYAVTNYLNSSYKINDYHFYYPASASSSDSIKKIINNGLSFLNYTGHGDAYRWLGPTVKVDSLKNINMYPFVISNACNTAEFNIASSFGNKMVVTGEKGAIGFIGCSNSSYWDEDFFWSVGAGTPSADPQYQGKGLGAYDRLFHTHNESPSEWYTTMGQINFAGNLAVSESTTSKKKYYWETYNLVGDPSVIPIIGKPDSFNITLPDTLPNGIKSYILNISPFAYVAVSHFDTLWDASFASESGSVTLNMPGLSNDSCLIVITGQNKYPLIKTVYFSAVSKEFINMTGTTINDSPGNSNGRVDLGESFFLKLVISNMGLTNASGLYAKISSTSDWIIINKDSVSIGPLAAESEIQIPEGLQMTITGSPPDLSRITLKLLLKDQYTEKHYTVDLTVHAPDLQIINCMIDDSGTGNGDYIPDSGETFNLVFKVRNLGSSDISGDLEVISPDPFINIMQQSVKSGSLKYGEVTSIPVMAKLAETVLTGSTVSLSATLKCPPFQLNKDFLFKVGKVRESFEAESFSVFPWYNKSKFPWTITSASAFDGIFSARSGTISHSSSTSLMIKTFYAAADSLKFFYKVSSELGYDTLVFRLNGKRFLRKSGEIPWTKLAIPVPSGLNKMEWVYYKDESVSEGLDCAWIDMIDFTRSSRINYIRNDLQVVKILTPVQKERYDQETISVIVRNLGKDPVSGFNLAYNINSSFIPEKQYFENTIPCDDSVTVSFKTSVNMSKYGIYNIVTYVEDNNDDYLLNDTAKLNIENINLAESLIVFPNPFNDQVTIHLKSPYSDKVQISISNTSGAKLYSIEKTIVSGRNTIDITNLRLAPAIYLLNIRGSSINRTVSIIKIKN